MNNETFKQSIDRLVDKLKNCKSRTIFVNILYEMIELGNPTFLWDNDNKDLLRSLKETVHRFYNNPSPMDRLITEIEESRKETDSGPNIKAHSFKIPKDVQSKIEQNIEESRKG